MNEKQHKMSFRLMSELNRRELQGTNNYFDCGEDGILHIWWGNGSWKDEVIVVEDASLWLEAEGR